MKRTFIFPDLFGIWHRCVQCNILYPKKCFSYNNKFKNPRNSRCRFCIYESTDKSKLGKDSKNTIHHLNDQPENNLRYCPYCNKLKTYSEFSKKTTPSNQPQKYIRKCNQCYYPILKKQREQLKIKKDGPIQKYNDTNELRQCSSCKQQLPLYQFYKTLNKYYLRICKYCKNLNIKIITWSTAGYLNKQGQPITKQDYLDSLIESNYSCQVCGSKNKLYLDHDHKTMKIRGILCNYCNITLTETTSPELLRNLANYLEKSST